MTLAKSACFVAFDLDGTLEDSRADMVAAIVRCRIELGVPERTYEELVPHVSKGMPHLYANAFDDAHDGTPERAAQIKAAFDEDYRVHICEASRLYPHIETALAALCQVGTLAVVTNKPESHSRALVEQLGISDYFATVVGGDSCAAPKPSPLPYEEAFARACRGAALQNVPRFMVGDSAGDMKVAAATNALGIWCAWGYHASPGDQEPAAVAETPAELSALVLRMVHGDA